MTLQEDNVKEIKRGKTGIWGQNRKWKRLENVLHKISITFAISPETTKQNKR